MVRAAVILLAVVGLSVGGVLGYQKLNPGIPADPPDWHGKVTAVLPEGLLITLDTDPPADPDRPRYRECVAKYSSDTPVRRRTGKAALPRVGQTVSVWCNGPFTSMNPATRPAGFVVIENG